MKAGDHEFPPKMSGYQLQCVAIILSNTLYHTLYQILHSYCSIMISPLELAFAVIALVILASVPLAESTPHYSTFYTQTFPWLELTITTRHPHHHNGIQEE